MAWRAGPLGERVRNIETMLEDAAEQLARVAEAADRLETDIRVVADVPDASAGPRTDPADGWPDAACWSP